MKKLEGLLVKSAFVAAALCAAVLLSAPAQAAAPKLTDHDLYCGFMPWLKLCGPAKPAAAPMVKAKHVAVVKHMAKPVVVAPKPVAMLMKAPHCVKRTDGKPYLLSCTYK